ncbi:hypothetical protein DACRYDRAFT_105497 [Dacryopinax primogenitus]|uniref:Histone H2A n=1 Tax=Dacryopinax primogenitus (strain DJM 731) TaxID=1858805 RepID=M5GDC9_DACPD|nr:uncharacterized protein DACRYDRAFT_105497 [Dacryopinax primogenitus]EJU04437.1 hypothetical protein DACRYDRAFT_105497 [Dacryopinax primogenitus]
MKSTAQYSYIVSSASPVVEEITPEPTPEIEDSSHVADASSMGQTESPLGTFTRQTHDFGLFFVDAVHRRLQYRAVTWRKIDSETALFCVSVLQAIVAEVLEMTGDIAHRAGHKTIKAMHLKYAFQEDEALSTLKQAMGCTVVDACANLDESIEEEHIDIKLRDTPPVQSEIVWDNISTRIGRGVKLLGPQGEPVPSTVPYKRDTEDYPPRAQTHSGRTFPTTILTAWQTSSWGCLDALQPMRHFFQRAAPSPRIAWGITARRA